MKNKTCKYCGQPEPYHTADCPVISAAPQTRREIWTWFKTLVGLVRVAWSARQRLAKNEANPFDQADLDRALEQLEQMQTTLRAAQR